MLFLLPAIALHNGIVIIGIEKTSPPLYHILMGAQRLLDIALMLWCYRWYVRTMEKRPALEIGPRGALPEFGRGLLLALAVVGATVGLLAASGSYLVAGAGSAWTLPQAVILFATGAFLQVVLFRLLLFRLCEEWLGTWLAFVMISIGFAAAHAINGNLTVIGFAGLAIGDVLLLGAFILTRRLWLVWRVRAGWNFLQDGVFGMPNSGVTELPSWLDAKITGPAWLTGGGFGIEASYPPLALSLVVGIALLVLAARRGQLVRPCWAREERPVV